MRVLVAIIIAITFVSCQPEGRVFSENLDLSPEVEWKKADTREFTVPVEDITKNYNLSLALRYIEGYQYQTANVKVTETSPSGKAVVKHFELKIREDNGEYIGDPALDIWDSEHTVELNKTYTEKGNYTYVIEHEMPNDPLIYVMEIGVILDIAK